MRELYLPDNSQPDGRPVFFEDRLWHFEREIGVVFAWLDAPAAPNQTADGSVCFRGRAAVIVRGPALVTLASPLASPFRVEPLPADPDNYWRYLRFPTAQLEFPLASELTCQDAEAPHRRVTASSCPPPSPHQNDVCPHLTSPAQMR